MADLGMYNFMKKSLAEGKTQEEITETLLKGGNKKEVIDATFEDVKHNKPPMIQKPTDSSNFVRHYDPYSRPTSITALCGYYFVTWIVSIVSTFILIINLSSGVDFNVTFNTQTLIKFGISLALFLSIFGIWYMKRWGVVLYIVSVLASLGYTLYQYKDLPSMSIAMPLSIALIVPVMMIIVGGLYFKRMT
jgi:hypothetical protein